MKFQQRAVEIARKTKTIMASYGYRSVAYYPATYLFDVYVDQRPSLRVYRIKAVTADEAGEIVAFCLMHGIDLPWVPEKPSCEIFTMNPLLSSRPEVPTVVEQAPNMWNKPVRIIRIQKID